MIYVLFVIVGSHNGITSFKHEFKTKQQCEKALEVIEKNLYLGTRNGFNRGICIETEKTK